MSASDWTKILFVLLLVVGFGLPWVVYFVDVYKGVQAFPVPKRRLNRFFLELARRRSKTPHYDRRNLPRIDDGLDRLTLIEEFAEP